MVGIIPGMDKNRFSQFEKRIQALVEGGFARLFAGRLQPREVALRLARAMEDGVDLDERGGLLAPNRYVVRLHPEDHAALLHAQPQLAARLVEHIVDLARESDLSLETPPEVRLVPDPALGLHSVAVLAEHHDGVPQSTQVMAPVKSPVTTSGTEALPTAFLVLDGSRYVALDQRVINVGRQRDNTIVVDDVRVSRQHCQLRFRFGHFVLYDLGSRGGTWVNGERVTECALHNGDVITLAGVALVYVQDESSPVEREPGDTQGGAL